MKKIKAVIANIFKKENKTTNKTMCCLAAILSAYASIHSFTVVEQSLEGFTYAAICCLALWNLFEMKRIFSRSKVNEEEKA